MRIITILLLSSVALYVAPVRAQDAAPAADESGESGEIVVIGRGETRQVQELNAQDLAVLTPGTSPLKAIEKLPSVNFQSADPFGNYEWSTRVTIRGFNQNQLGFNLDGIPLGDMTYGNNNGLHISRAIAPENIGITRVAQGSGSLGTQSTNNLGGTLEFFSLDPKDGLGADASLTYGSENTMRAFGRVQFGEAGQARGFVSGMWQTADKWKGDGKQGGWMVNAKAIIPLGGAELDAYFSRSDRAEQDYQDLSLGMIQRLGYNWDNFGPKNYALAVQVADIATNRGETGATVLNPAAGTTYPAPIATADDAYYDASGLRKDTIAAVGLKAPLGDALTFRIKGYYHENDGQGTWGTPYVASPTGVPMAVRTTEYDLKRTGVFTSLNADLGANAVTVGGWYESNDFNQARRFYAYASRTAPGLSHRNFMTNPFFTQWDIDFTTKTLQYYVQDKISLGDTTINIGWKGFQVKNEATANVAGGRPVGKIRSKDWFQPHVGVAHKFNGNLEAFAGFTQATRAFTSSVTSGPYSTTQAGFDAITGTLKPEESDTFELGARYNTAKFNGTIGVYHVNFRNRLLGITTGAGIVGNPAVLQNVGSVRAIGFEAAGDFKLGGGLSVFASYSYNDTTYQDDVVNALGTVLAATKGKTVVDTPKHLLRGELAYDSDSLFGKIGVNYMSKRYFTYTNALLVASDGKGNVGSRALVDATLGYRFDLGLRSPVEIQLNATNLLDKKYVSTIGSNGFGNIGDNQTFLTGAPQQFFLTLKGGF
ncbi:MAG: TonB-dependent receptor [Sphingomonadales bacterium]|nr:TonB-dependent receptor [Sphingomonadales bacterium]